MPVVTRNEVIGALVAVAVTLSVCLAIIGVVVLARSNRESLPNVPAKAEAVNLPSGYPDFVAFCVHGAALVSTRPDSGGLGRASVIIVPVPSLDSWCGGGIDDGAVLQLR